MTPHADLVARLRKFVTEYRKIQRLDPEMVYALHSEYEERFAPLLLSDLEAAADALAALPPPADPLYEYCPSCRRLGPLFGLTAIRSEETGGRHCIACYGKTESRLLPLWTEPPASSRPADPPALVALVREIQDERRLTPEGETSARMMALAQALLAYPLPAAPLVTEKE